MHRRHKSENNFCSLLLHHHHHHHLSLTIRHCSRQQLPTTEWIMSEPSPKRMRGQSLQWEPFINISGENTLFESDEFLRKFVTTFNDGQFVYRGRLFCCSYHVDCPVKMKGKLNWEGKIVLMCTGQHTNKFIVPTKGLPKALKPHIDKWLNTGKTLQQVVGRVQTQFANSPNNNNNNADGLLHVVKELSMNGTQFKLKIQTRKTKLRLTATNDDEAARKACDYLRPMLVRIIP